MLRKRPVHRAAPMRSGIGVSLASIGTAFALATLLAVGLPVACTHTTPPTAAQSGASSADSAKRTASTAPAASSLRSPKSSPPAGPDAPGICAALDSKESDPWRRFGNVIPVEIGGLLFVLRGEESAANGVNAKLGLRQSTVIACTGGRLVTWMLAADTRPEVQASLVNVFEEAGVRFEELFAFPEVEASARLRKLCKNERACCDFCRLLCRFAGKESLDGTCADGVAEPPPEWGVHCSD